MLPITACPTAEQLQRFLLATLTDSEAEALEQHLSACPHCLPALRAVRADDPLVEALRAQASLPSRVPGEEVVRLIERLKALPASGQNTVAATEAGTPTSSPSEEADPSEDPSRESFDFLAPPKAPGELGWLGPYRVQGVLGTGGMGVVFRAEDPQLQRLVALKVMLPALAASGSAKQRFLREARAAAAVQHDHIVTIHQVGEDRGVPFLAMEFLKGESLDERLQREGRLPLAEVVRIGREIA
jgi:eukaryotic-like serine/threonine-protein kinase